MRYIFLLITVLNLHAADNVRERKVFSASNGSFSCSMPKAWRKTVYPSSGKTAIYGVEFTSVGGAASVFAEYYSGSVPSAGMDVYIKRNSLNPLNAAGVQAGAVSKCFAGNKESKTFERVSSSYLPPGSPKAVEIKMKELFVVIPASKGFYVLRLKARKENFDNYINEFNAVKNSFKPLY